jgi:DNA-binding NtrC family response regulator
MDNVSVLPRMLCVDDEVSILRQLRMLFRGLFEVTMVSDATEAVDLLRNGGVFDVIICDQQMPKLLGVNVLEIAREVVPKAGRVLLTGYCDPEAVVASVNVGSVDWFVTKPWDVADMRKKAAQAARPSVLARAEPIAVEVPAPIAATVSESTIVFVGHGRAEAQSFGKELRDGCTCIFVDTFEQAVAQFERDRLIPDVMVIAIDAQSPRDQSNLERLKSSLPSVVLIIICDTAFATATIHLINYTKPFRFLAAPVGHRLLVHAIEAGLDRAATLRESPDLLEAARPEVTAETLENPLSIRLKGVWKSLAARFGTKGAPFWRFGR